MAQCAGEQVVDMVEITSPDDDDLVYVVADPSGTPADRGCQVVNLMRNIGARAYNDANVSIPNNVWTSVSLNSERWDTDGIHDTVVNNSRLTCQTAGTYMIVANGRFDWNATGWRGIRIYLNGATAIAMEDHNSGGNIYWGATVTTIYELDVGDYVEMQAYQNRGGALNLLVDGNNSPEFMMQKIG